MTEWKTSAEQSGETLLAVGLVVLLFERALVELALAVRADEMLRVIFAVHGRDAAAGHRLVTGDTERAAAGVEMRLAVRQTFVVVKTLCTERCATFLHHSNKRSTLTQADVKPH